MFVYYNSELIYTNQTSESVRVYEYFASCYDGNYF